MVRRLRDFVPPQLWRAAATDDRAAEAARSEPPSCAAILARLWLIYYTQVSVAVDGWYRIEDTDACAVATAAGMTTDCRSSSGGEVFLSGNRSAPAARTLTASRSAGSTTTAVGQPTYYGHKNKDGLSLTYEDIARSHGGPHVAAGLRALAQRFGYPDE